MKAILLMILMSFYAFANIGTIMALKGEASVVRGTPLKAKMGMPIEQGDRVVTGSQSRVQVMLKDETVVTIGSNSSFDFKEFSFDGTKNSKVNLKANRGFFRTVTGQIGKVAPNRFKVKTVSATIGIRGTDFGAHINADNKEIIVCYSGSIIVEIDGDGSRIIDSGMLLEIINRGIDVESKLSKIPLQKVIYQSGVTPEEISDISDEILKAITEQTELKEYPDHTPDYVPNFHEEYTY